jgi:hypothetical protein
MLIKELPDGVRRELRARLPDDVPLESVANLTISQLPLWFQARCEDLDRKIGHQLRHLACLRELDEITQPCADLPLSKVEYFLRGAARTRFQTLMRELDELSEVPLVTYHRKKWHSAVESEIARSGSTNVDGVVAAVLAQDPAYPAERVRAYAEYILETAAAER